MPFTEAQRKLFHVAQEDKDVAREHGMAPGEARRLADEADRLKREGREKKASGFIDLKPALGLTK
jgi:hypothetical protein